MTKQIENLITALREELQQYGEMLALLEQQQEADNLRAAEDLLLSISTVNAQTVKIQQARQQREATQAELAASLGRSSLETFASLVPLLPDEYQPLVSALVHENNELLVRVRQRARQNQILFRRSVESLQRFLNSLSPATTETSVPAPPLIATADMLVCGAVT